MSKNQQYDDDDAGYGSAGESYEGVGSEYEEVAAAPVAAGELEHIQSDQVWGVQRAVIALGINLSPSEAARRPALCEVALADHLHDYLLRVDAINNRMNPADHEKKGDTNQMVITGIKMKGYISQFAAEPIHVDVGVSAHRTLTNNRRTTAVLEYSPTFVSYELNLYDPKDKMTKDMLRIWERCDPSVLKKEFQYLEDANGRKCLINAKGVAAGLLERAKDGEFDNHVIQAKDYIVPGTDLVQIPAPIMEKLYNYMEKSITSIQKSFVSAKDIKLSFSPESGKWDNKEFLVGDAITLTKDKKIEYETRVLNTRNRIAPHLEVEYIVVDKVQQQQPPK
jgi:hypothetical protein